MSTKTANGTRYVYRYFHAESGVCLTASEARKLPGRSVVVETLCVPGKNKKAVVGKAPPPGATTQIHSTFFDQVKMAVTVFYNRVKQQLSILEKKKDHGLFEVKNPLVEGLTARFPFVATREVKVVNNTAANAEA